MQIYYIANARMPTQKAHGIQLAKMCEAFIGRGAELELVVPSRRNEIRQSPEKFYSLEKPIKVRKLPVLDLYSLGRAGFTTGSFSFLCSYFFYIRAKAAEHEREHCIIYTTDLDQFSFLGVPFLGIPYFIEIHDAKNYSLSFAVLFRRASGIIVINNLIKDKIVKVFGVNPEKIIVRPNGIDTRQFSAGISKKEARTRLGLPLESKIALYSGRCYPWKGLEILKEAAEASSEIYFYFVGATAKDFIRVTGRNSLPSNLIFQGEKPYGEMPFWLAAADILLCCGTAANEYSYRHTSPMKLFEYMASGRPIVAADTPANHEILSEDEVFFYTPDKPEALGDALRRILFAPEETQNRAEAALKKVSDFAWDIRARSILDFMESRIRLGAS